MEGTRDQGVGRVFQHRAIKRSGKEREREGVGCGEEETEEAGVGGCGEREI